MALIISGHQRSGTTLLRRVCDSHPQIAVANEFGCFADVGLSVRQALLARFAQWRLVNGRWAFDSQYATHPRRHWHNLRFTLGYWRQLARLTNGEITAPEISQALHHQFQDVQIVGDKLPQYMPNLPDFALTEKIKVVVIYRDCRDVTSSFLEKVRTVWRDRSWAGEVDTAAKIARNWVEKIDLMEHLADQIHTIRYESLIKEPDTVLADLGRWLAVDPAGFKRKMIKSGSVGKHRQGLTQAELADVWVIAGSVMTRLGYSDAV